MQTEYMARTGRVRITRGDGSIHEYVPFSTGRYEALPDYRHPLFFWRRDRLRPYERDGWYLKFGSQPDNE
jgi:hypothetical protein